MSSLISSPVTLCPIKHFILSYLHPAFIQIFHEFIFRYFFHCNIFSCPFAFLAFPFPTSFILLPCQNNLNFITSAFWTFSYFEDLSFLLFILYPFLLLICFF